MTRRKVKGFEEGLLAVEIKRGVDVSDNRNAARVRAKAKARVRRRDRRTEKQGRHESDD